MRVALPVFRPRLGPRVLDLPVSGFSAALFAPTLLDEPTKQTTIRMKTESKRTEPPALGKEVYCDGLGSGTRSEFSSCFVAALILGHWPCHEENRIAIFLFPFGQPGRHSLHQQRPRTRRLQRILRPVLCAFGSGRLVSVEQLTVWRQFESTREFFHSLHRRNRVAILDTRKVTTEQTCSFFDIALR
jgi:hypothetical protein